MALQLVVSVRTKAPVGLKDLLRHDLINVGALVYNSTNLKEREKMLDTTNWARYEFTIGGLTFVSLVNQAGTIYPKVSMLPRPVLDDINRQAILSLVGNVEFMTRTEIQEKLAEANEFASQALLELV